MGMAVKGLGQHRLVAKAMGIMLAECMLTEDELADARRLRQRADLAIDRLKRRKRLKAERREAERGIEGSH